MTAGVYAIINTITGRTYVGSSRTIEIRWSGWRSVLNRGLGGNKQLQADWAATQGQFFDFRILEEAPVNDKTLEEAERRWIDQYAGRCYNVHMKTTRATPGQVLTRLREVRIAASLTVRMLAKKAGVSPAAISNAERGRMTHGSTTKKLTDVLGVHWYKLISAEKEQAIMDGQARLEARMQLRESLRLQRLIEEQHPKRRHPRPTPPGSEP